MTVRFDGGKRITADYNGFQIATDQAPDSGGDGSAPEPYDLFLASLATCAGIYVLNFCDRRNIPTDGITLSQRWEREDGKIARITIEVRVPESFPEKYHPALVRAASLCAVKKTMETPPAMDVKTVVEG